MSVLEAIELFTDNMIDELYKTPVELSDSDREELIRAVHEVAGIVSETYKASRKK